MAIDSYDIVSTLQALGMMKYWKGKHIILKKQVGISFVIVIHCVRVYAHVYALLRFAREIESILSHEYARHHAPSVLSRLASSEELAARSSISV